MNISFNNLPLGEYTEEDLEKQWNVKLSRGVSDDRCNIVDVGGENVLEVTLQKGKVGPIDGGVSWRYMFDKTYDEMTVEYKVMLGDGFDHVRGGKLPGLCGGTSPGGGASTKEADGFSIRVMWREMGTLEDYIYHIGRDENKNWGTDYLWLKSINKGNPISDDMWDTLNVFSNDRLYLTPGKWHTIKSYVKMNTPGSENGKIISWLNGEEVLNTNICFRKDTSFGVDSFRFTTFFGGNDETWAPSKDEKIYFKDIKFEP